MANQKNAGQLQIAGLVRSFECLERNAAPAPDPAAAASGLAMHLVEEANDLQTEAQRAVGNAAKSHQAQTSRLICKSCSAQYRDIAVSNMGSQRKHVNL